MFDIPAKNNPLPWTEHWLNSKGQQNAPQETEIESYVIGGIKQDVKSDSFAGFFSDAEWDSFLDKTDQPSNPFAEAQWEMEKKKAQQQERNTRHSVDKGQEFIKSGMTLITDVESDRYLKKTKKVSE